MDDSGDEFERPCRLGFTMLAVQDIQAPNHAVPKQPAAPKQVQVATPKQTKRLGATPKPPEASAAKTKPGKKTRDLEDTARR
eukprot:1547882-Heterocapsa_arctica.AAC.1